MMFLSAAMPAFFSSAFTAAKGLNLCVLSYSNKRAQWKLKVVMPFKPVIFSATFPQPQKKSRLHSSESAACQQLPRTSLADVKGQAETGTETEAVKDAPAQHGVHFVRWILLDYSGF